MRPGPPRHAPAGLSRKICGAFLTRWLKWLACLAASLLYGPAAAATGDNGNISPAANAATPAPASNPATAPPGVAPGGSTAAEAKPASPATSDAAKPPMATREEMGMRNALVHDPSTIVKCKDEYWVFNTGNGIVSWHSKDLVTWTRGQPLFTVQPEWIADVVPGNRGVNFWAPDVTFFKGRYLLYYAVSTQGSQTSAIGLATNPTLDQTDPNYKWTDQGMVIHTQSRRDVPASTDNFNAIDPAIVAAPDGKLWLAMGSFWSGIKLVELDPATGKRIAPDSKIYALATNNNPQHDVEGSYIYHHGDYYYLFVNWGKCCSGVASTYKIMVGRSKEITGPYLDKAGVDLAKGGGTLFLGSEGDFIGPGHAGIIEVDGKYWFSCHFYDGAARGASKLATRLLHWDADGWPAIEPTQNYVAENTRTAPPRGRAGAPGVPGAGSGARGRGRGTAGTAPAPAGTPAPAAATPATSATPAASGGPPA